MMLSASPSSLAKSSLEEMLDSLRRREEKETKPKDSPPALPARPASRARLPPARRSLPSDFKVRHSSGCTTTTKECFPNEGLPNGFNDAKRKENELQDKRTRSCFGSKKAKEMDVESPYVVASEECFLTLAGSADCFASSGKIGELEEDDSISYFIKKKLHVWCRPPSGQWELGIIQSSSGQEVSVSLSNRKVIKVARSELVPANPEIIDGGDDLLKLCYLNEPSVLHMLKFRYLKDMVYTKAGPILIALNPFKDLHICGNEFVSAYREKYIDCPHVCAVASAAFNKLVRDEVNQSIIISGESGSGKTETAKIAMQCFVSLGSSISGIEDKILQANHILEAFGNSKTSRNDNSSRFGKLIEIHFSTMGKIHGATIQSFLLEKSRVVQLANGERSYHIFYQLCAGASSGLRERLNLRAASEYKYLNQSDCIRIDGVDDAVKFHQLMKALDTVRISKDDQELIFKMLAAILWLGNISFKVMGSANQIQVVDDEAVTSASKMMGCSSQELMAALSTHIIHSDRDSVAKMLTLQQAIDMRDAIAKFIYTSLFDWLVEQVNKSLKVGTKYTGQSISIIDMFGYQSFQKNSFEEFSINYANERLQQHLNRHLIKLEQADYELDGIDRIKVNFEDNQECLDLFEKKPLGLLSLLDEESNLPEASDLTLAIKLKQHLDTHPCFKGEKGRAFNVRHYAGEVLYDTNGFLEKNRDTLPSGSIQFLSLCNCELLLLFSKTFGQSQKQSNTFGTGALDPQEQTVVTKFKDQLFKLMKQLESSRPHFIHCIRPNTKQLPGIYDEDLVLQQLRCCGVLEVVRISRAGFSTRMTHQEFSRRYGFLLSDAHKSKDPLSTSVAVLKQFNIPSEMFQVGFTKLYLRSGQIGALELKRNQVLCGILGVQKCFRGHQARSYFCELKNAVATLQSFVRGEITRRKSGVTVKSWMTIHSKSLEDIQAVILLQSVIRGWLVRTGASRENKLNNYHEITKPRWKDISKDQVQNLPSALAELQRRVVKAEATVDQKEVENAELREQLKQSQRKWAEYEEKMKSMEETWQKQRASLQMSLVAAKRSLASENGTTQPAIPGVLFPHYYDSEDATSIGSRTTGASTPNKFSSSVSVSDAGREANGTMTTLGNLMKEFDQQRQNFDDEVKALNDVKPGQSASTNSVEELQKLKQRFEGWKKQYKFRLREAKTKVHKGNSEVGKSRRTWWGKLVS